MIIVHVAWVFRFWNLSDNTALMHIAQMYEFLESLEFDLFISLIHYIFVLQRH